MILTTHCLFPFSLKVKCDNEPLLFVDGSGLLQAFGLEKRLIPLFREHLSFVCSLKVTWVDGSFSINPLICWWSVISSCAEKENDERTQSGFSPYQLFMKSIFWKFDLQLMSGGPWISAFRSQGRDGKNQISPLFLGLTLIV